MNSHLLCCHPEDTRALSLHAGAGLPGWNLGSADLGRRHLVQEPLSLRHGVLGRGGCLDGSLGVWSVEDGGDGSTGVGRGGEILGGHTPAPWSVDRHRQPGLKRGLVGRLYHEDKPTLKRPLPDTPAAPSSLPVGFSTAPGPGSALRERPVTLLSKDGWITVSG